ncbi:MAG: hypothetical protein L6R38_000066 [Xanthoria sp. 2 TBL-2021]|nr:MAG: hypothetical protein L6R38_000066 [Xanthoria sp. 2 TBL-2021]
MDDEIEVLLPSSRERKRRTCLNPTTYPPGTRKSGEGLPNRHVRFEPASAPLPSRPLSPSPLPKKRYTSAYQSVSAYQRSASVARTVPERLRFTSKDKGTVTPARRIEELTRENGLLRQELLHYKETHAILINFLHINERLQKGLRGSMEDTMQRLSVAEQPLRDYWGMDNGGKDETETIF